VVSSDHSLKIVAHKVKGTVPREFDFGLFHESVSPKSLSIPPVSAFKTAGVVYNSGKLPLVPLMPAVNLPAGIVDTCGEFSTGINDTSGTSGKKTTGVVNTGGAT
jgi:hypothetical protein